MEVKVSPIMTSNITPEPYIISASSYYNEAWYPAWKAFDGELTTDSHWVTNKYPSWLKIDYGKNQKVTRYTIKNMETVSNSPRDWTFEGSNDDFVNDVNILDRRSSVTNWTAKETKSFDLQVQGNYRYYRINVSGNNGGTYLYIVELTMYNNYLNKILLSSNNKTYSLTPPIYATETAISQMTSAVSNIGEASADSYNNSDYPWNAFNGVANGSRPFWYTTNVRPEGGHWLQFNFFEPKAIYKISLKTFIVTSGNYSIKDFELYASNDGIKYTILTHGTHPNRNIRAEYSFENKEKYKYYRLNVLNSYVSDINAGVDLLEMFEYFPSDLITLPNQSEQTFLKYGMESLINLNEFNKTQNIESNSTTHEAGKIFTHTVDLSKRKVDKILFS